MGLFLADGTARRLGLDAGKLWNLCVVALFAAIVTTRLLLVAINCAELRQHPAWLLGLSLIHHPLFAYWGALVAAFTAVLYGRWLRLPLGPTADALTAPLALALAFKQLGALVSGAGF